MYGLARLRSVSEDVPDGDMLQQIAALIAAGPEGAQGLFNAGRAFERILMAREVPKPRRRRNGQHGPFLLRVVD